ncbi:MAG TPA: Rrf2 family transcriptional regulator [Bryobacteraceae bacterium]|nr:Rrf2 family transcriptional regulator [Bryobacteraceae bacterium]
MRLTHASDSAIQILTYLAGIRGRQRATAEEISEQTGLPPVFLNELIQKLVRPGFVSARPGTRGGFSLAMRVEDISILQVFESIDGNSTSNECLSVSGACPRSGHCDVQNQLQTRRGEVEQILNGVTLDTLVRDGVEAHIAPLRWGLQCDRR